MDQDGPLRGIAHIFEHRDQMVEIMPVDRADIVEAQFLEQRAAHRHAAGEFVGLARGVRAAGAGRRRGEALGAGRAVPRNGRDDTSRAR